MEVTTQEERTSRATQRGRLLVLLESRGGGWVPLPEILALRIACYSTRILELRRLGHRIENKREGRKSFFRLEKCTPLAGQAEATITVRDPDARNAAGKELNLFSPSDLEGAQGVYSDPEECFR